MRNTQPQFALGNLVIVVSGSYFGGMVGRVTDLFGPSITIAPLTDHNEGHWRQHAHYTFSRWALEVVEDRPHAA